MYIHWNTTCVHIPMHAHSILNVLFSETSMLESSKMKESDGHELFSNCVVAVLHTLVAEQATALYLKKLLEYM